MFFKYFLNIIHLGLIILLLIYPYIISKNYLYDACYIFLFIFGKLSWILCKDECYISYLFKKIENPDYILGNNSRELSDITKIYKNKYLQCIMTVLVILFPIIYAINIIIVNLRSNIIPKLLMYLMILFYFIYLYYVHFIKRIIIYNNRKNILINLFKFIYFIFLIYIIYNFFIIF
jgi:hypothetical protein